MLCFSITFIPSPSFLSFMYLFIYFWLHWVFTAVHGLLTEVPSLVTKHRLQGVRASVVAAPGLQRDPSAVYVQRTAVYESGGQPVTRTGRNHLLSSVSHPIYGIFRSQNRLRQKSSASSSKSPSSLPADTTNNVEAETNYPI